MFLFFVCANQSRAVTISFPELNVSNEVMLVIVTCNMKLDLYTPKQDIGWCKKHLRLL